MNQQTLSAFIWSVADLLRGDYKQSDYSKVILPFTVLRRLDCVLEATKPLVLAELADKEAGRQPRALDHAPDDFTRGEVLPGGLVADFGELADQLFKHQTHLHVADDLGVQVDLGKFFCHLVQQPGLGWALDLGVEFKALKHIAHGGRERLHIAEQVLRDVVGVAQQLFEVERGAAVEALARPAQQKFDHVTCSLGLAIFI